MKDLLIATNSQKALDFLISNPGREYLAMDIQKSIGISRAGTNFALRDLVKADAISMKKRGKVHLYVLNHRHFVIKQLKILKTVVSLTKLISKLSYDAKKIILYGSASRGEDTRDSDIDLFVIANIPDVIRKIVENYKPGRKIQLTIRTPVKYAEMPKTDPVFYGEIERGIILMEGKE
jgi:predicted nucleotidyltransferase